MSTRWNQSNSTENLRFWVYEWNHNCADLFSADVSYFLQWVNQKVNQHNYYRITPNPCLNLCVVPSSMLILSWSVRSRTLSFVFSPPILACLLSPSNVYLFAGGGWWKGSEGVGQREPWAESRACSVLSVFSSFSLSSSFFRFSPPRPQKSCSCLVPMMSPVWTFPTAVHSAHALFALPLFVPWTFAGGLCLNAAPWLSPQMPRVTDVLTLTKGCSAGLHASQPPPLPTAPPWRFQICNWQSLPFLGKNLQVAMGPATTGLGSLPRG